VASAHERRVVKVLPYPLTDPSQFDLYSFHASEMGCIGRGKANAPCEFGVKVAIVTTNARAPGGQFALHAKALPGMRRISVSGQKCGVFGVIKRVALRSKP
jgi:hypothetical protein